MRLSSNKQRTFLEAARDLLVTEKMTEMNVIVLGPGSAVEECLPCSPMPKLEDIPRFCREYATQKYDFGVKK